MHQTLSANRAGMKFNVCERLLPPRPLLFHTIPDSLSWLSLLHRALRDDTKNGHIELIRFKEYSWVARDVTKNQTKKLSILLSFYVG